jgi:hypothetical protein
MTTCNALMSCTSHCHVRTKRFHVLLEVFQADHSGEVGFHNEKVCWDGKQTCHVPVGAPAAAFIQLILPSQVA